MPALSMPSAVALATAHPDEAHQLLAHVYASHKVRLQGRVDRFHFRFRDNGLGGLSRSVLEHSHASLITDIAPFGHVVAGRILEGTYTCRMGSEEITATKGDWFLIDPDLPSDMTWSPDVKILTARFDRATLDRLTAGLTGHDPDQPVRYPLSSARSPQHARALDQLDQYLRSLLASDVTRDSPLIHDQAARLVAAHFQEAFPISAGDPEVGNQAGPASLRRALAFIDDHHDADIGLPEIAGAARVSPRALQQEFRKHENITPLAYLRRTRLAAAHRDLREADPGAGITVSDIAIRWGFANPGRFATAYREAYGEQPSHTLHNLSTSSAAAGRDARSCGRAGQRNRLSAAAWSSKNDQCSVAFPPARCQMSADRSATGCPSRSAWKVTRTTPCVSLARMSWGSVRKVPPVSSITLPKKPMISWKPWYSPVVWLDPPECQTMPSSNRAWTVSMSPELYAAYPRLSRSSLGCAICCSPLARLITSRNCPGLASQELVRV